MFDKSRIVSINNIELKESAILLKAQAAFLHLFPNNLLIFEIVKFPKSGYKIRKINPDLYRFMLAKLRIVFTISVMPEPGGPGGPMAPPIFGRSVNPIPTGKDRLSPPITTGTPNVFHLPASLYSTNLPCV